MDVVKAIILIIGAIIIVWLAAFIFDTVTGISAKAHDIGSYHEHQTAAVEAVGWRRRQARRNDYYRDRSWRRGYGPAPYYGPYRYYNPRPYYRNRNFNFGFGYYGPGPSIRFGW